MWEYYSEDSEGDPKIKNYNKNICKLYKLLNNLIINWMLKFCEKNR